MAPNERKWLRVSCCIYGRASSHVSGSSSGSSTVVCWQNSSAGEVAELRSLQPGCWHWRAGEATGRWPERLNHGPPGEAAEGVVHRRHRAGHLVGQTTAQLRSQRRLVPMSTSLFLSRFSSELFSSDFILTLDQENYLIQRKSHQNVPPFWSSSSSLTCRYRDTLHSFRH